MEASERYIPAIAEKSGKHVAVIGAPTIFSLLAMRSPFMMNILPRAA